MRKLIKACAALLLTAASSAYAGNYATCLLDNLAGVKNAVATSAAISLCKSRFPDQFLDIQRGSGKGILGFSSPEQCTLEKSKATSWTPAAGLIKKSCACLYGTASGAFDMCESEPLPADLASMHDLSTPEKKYKVEKHWRAVFRAHEDAYQIMHTDAFWQWLNSSKDRQAKMMNGTSDQVARLFDEYKRDRWSKGLSSTSDKPTFTYEEALGLK